MRRVTVVAWAVAVVIGLIAVGFAVGAAAQDDAPASLATHPMVGSWREGRNGGSHVSVFADGIVIQTFADGATWHGAWRLVDAPGMIATYEIETWTEGVGQGIASFAMVAPRPDSFDPVGTPTG